LVIHPPKTRSCRSLGKSERETAPTAHPHGDGISVRATPGVGGEEEIKNIINQFGEYKLNFKTAADYEFMLRYLYRHNVKAYYLPNLLVKMRIGGMSNSNMKNRMAANRNDRLAMKANGLPFPFIVSLLKPLSKLHQYLFK
jgi:hypothetical protein